MMAAVETQFCIFWISIWKHRKSLHCKIQEPWTTFNKDGWQDALQSRRISVNSFKPLTVTSIIICEKETEGINSTYECCWRALGPAAEREGAPHARGVRAEGRQGWTCSTRVTSKQSGCLLELDCTPGRNHWERHQNAGERQERGQKEKTQRRQLGNQTRKYQKARQQII